VDLDLRKTLQDTAYVAVGVGVIGLQQAQVRRREAQARIQARAKGALDCAGGQAQAVRDRLESRAEDVRTRAGSLPGDVRGRVEPVVGDLRVRVEPIVEQLQAVPQHVAKVVEIGRARVQGRVATSA